MSHDIFEKLESNDKKLVDEIKLSIRDQFSKVTEPWLINGLYEYYLNTSSVRSIEVLINLKEPHHQYLFDRICDSIKSNKVEPKVQALTLLGHIARSPPTWLYKLSEHALFREILRFLQSESELLPLISALLVLIILLPMFPSSFGPYLDEVFDIFRRLAAWNSIPGKLVEEQIIHLQVSLYSLFLRLYGMYPCNFLTYLRMHFKDKNKAVFVHTIKPMLDAVKMHPSLVTTSKENEAKTERWVQMGPHDVIVECERFSLEFTDRCPHDTCQSTGFRSRSGTTNSTMESSYPLQSLKSLASLQMASSDGGSFFTPSQLYQVHTPPVSEGSHIQGVSNIMTYQEGTSPPEAAIEATPETTPIRDLRASSTFHHPITPRTGAARALTTLRSGSIGLVTPTHSQPSSPMRKEPTPFVYPTTETNKFGSLSNQKLIKLIQERQQANNESEVRSKPPPSSPLRIINPSEASPRRTESPLSLEDEEVSSIVSGGGNHKKVPVRTCDSILPEFDDVKDSKEDDAEYGSPCSVGGLHMPNSKSMTSFKKRISRIRYHSQCNPETEKIGMSSSSSPGNGLNLLGSTLVRRANSCPEMEKSPVVCLKGNIRRPFYETDEDTVSEDHAESISNGLDAKKPATATTTTQTENFWPMPYEHLFLTIFPSVEPTEGKPTPAPSPAPNQGQPFQYDILDRYIEKAATISDNKSLSEQLQLLHQQLLFERYRRETHAYRNRRLLSDAKSTRLLEEYNSALRDQVQLKQKDIDDLRKQLEDYRAENLQDQARLTSTIQYWEEKFKALQDDNMGFKQTNYQLSNDLQQYKEQCGKLEKEKQDALDGLVDAIAEANIAKEQAQSGEKVRNELQRSNREVLLLGELVSKYKEQLEKLPGRRECLEELNLVKESYREEIKMLRQQLESKSAQIEAYRSRVNELEHVILAKDEVIMANKRTLVAVNDERQAMIEAVESKYNAQKTINGVLEQKVFELMQRLDLEAVKRNVNSPDTSSCHEVQVTTTGGLSPHSSPLSASLASSDGSVPVHDREVRNLQVIVDQPEASTADAEPSTSRTD